MLLGNFELVAGLGEGDAGSVQLFSGQRSLFEEFLAALVDGLLGLESLLGGLEIQSRFLNFLGETGGSGDLVSCLGLLIGTASVLGSSREVAVFQHSQQLSLVHFAATFHIEGLNRCTDLGDDGGPLQWK